MTLPSLFRKEQTLPLRTASLATPLALGTGRLSISPGQQVSSAPFLTGTSLAVGPLILL